MAAAFASILLFAISLLAILPAPAYILWMLAIIVSEYVWAASLVAGGFTLLNYKLKGPVHWTTLLTALTFVLFLSPLLRAIVISRTLPEDMNAAFNKKPVTSSTTPFTHSGMFRSLKLRRHVSSAYQSIRGTALQMDFYPSMMEGIRPCVIVVHGGSWKSGDNKQLPELNSLLALTGYHVAAINYRLAPKSQFPSQVDDVKAAVSYLKKMAIQWRIDADKLVLLGRSAGAQIALMAAYTLDDPSIKGVVDFYGPADMVWGYSIPSNPLIMDSRKVMSDYLGGSYDAKPAAFENSSPLRFVSKVSPPTLIIHGQNDVLVAYEHSRRLNKALGDNNVPHYFLTLPWATHGFDFNLHGPGGQLSTYAVVRFLSEVTH